MKQVYEWDNRKAQINLPKHKVGFDEGETTFDNPFLVTYIDELHSEQEDRFIIVSACLKMSEYYWLYM